MTKLIIALLCFTGFACGADQAALVQFAGAPPVKEIPAAAKQRHTGRLLDEPIGKWHEVTVVNGAAQVSDQIAEEFTKNTRKRSENAGAVERLDKVIVLMGKPTVFLINDGPDGMQLIQPNANGTVYLINLSKDGKTVQPGFRLFKVEKHP